MKEFTLVSATTFFGVTFKWDTFWQAAAALVAAVALLRSFWAINPCRLIYVVKKPVSLADAKLGNDDPASRRLQELAAGLTNAKTLKVIIAARGRRDITSESFDQNQAIVVEANAPITAVLQHSRPQWLRVPTASTQGKQLVIGPGLIGKRQCLSYWLLIDDAAPKATFQSALTNVVIKRSDDYSPVLSVGMRWYIPWLLGLGYLVWLGWLITESFWITYWSGLAAVLVAYIPAWVTGKWIVNRDGLISSILEPEDACQAAPSSAGQPSLKATTTSRGTQDGGRSAEPSP
jgi:hypothetical protein